jgi:hypothetical protein
MGHIRIVFQELLEGAHDLAPFEIGRRAVRVLSYGVSAPGKAAGEGARDHFGDHSHTGIFVVPARKQALSRDIRAVGSRRTPDQRCDQYGPMATRNRITRASITIFLNRS